MRIVTFNLRCDHRQDGENCFVFRQPLILKAIGVDGTAGMISAISVGAVVCITMAIA